ARADAGRAGQTRSRDRGATLLPRGAVVIQLIHACRNGDESDRTDRIELEAPDIVFAAHEESVERRRDFAAIAGNVTRQNTHAYHMSGRQALAEMSNLDLGLNRVHAAAQEAAGELNLH